MTCWYSKRRCYVLAFVVLNKYQRVFYTWYEIRVGARFGVRLISWSRRVLLVWNRSLLLAFCDILFSFISTITSKSSALRVSGSDFLEVSVSTLKPGSHSLSQSRIYHSIDPSIKINENQISLKTAAVILLIYNINQLIVIDFYWPLMMCFIIDFD